MADSAHTVSIASFASLPRPKLPGPLQFSGRKPGSERLGPSGERAGSPVQLELVPSAPRLLNQQLPVVVGNSSHQKSTPFGSCGPCGARPSALSLNRVSNESDVGFAIVQDWVPGVQ